MGASRRTYIAAAAAAAASTFTSAATKDKEKHMPFKRTVTRLGELVADSIVGAVYATSEAGNRLVIRNDGAAGVMEFYTGLAGELKGQINPDTGAGGAHEIKLQTSASPSGNNTVPGTAILRSNAAGIGATAQLYLSLTDLVIDDAGTGLGGSVHATKGLTVDGSVQVNGAHVNAQGDIHAGTGLFIDSIPTGGSTANVFMNSSGGLFKITSSARFKTDIEPAAVDVDAALALEPKTYTRTDTCEEDAPREVGFIAEDADALGLGPWVMRDTAGTVESFDYLKWVVALQAIVRKQRDQIEGLTARLEALERKETSAA